jgi:hypothetical protein
MPGKGDGIALPPKIAMSNAVIVETAEANVTCPVASRYA